MAEIVLSRPDEPWANRVRGYKIVVDGDVLASLRRGEDATVAVAAGHHTVRAKIDWGRSKDVDLELGENDRAYLLCQSGFRNSFVFPRAWLYVTIWRKRYLDLGRIFHLSSGVIPEHWPSRAASALITSRMCTPAGR